MNSELPVVRIMQYCKIVAAERVRDSSGRPGETLCAKAPVPDLQRIARPRGGNSLKYDVQY